MEKFRKELETLINENSLENGSDTPDFILADYLVRCLRTFNLTVTARSNWYGDHSGKSQDTDDKMLETKRMVIDLNDINRTIPEGRLLFAALVKISTESQTNKTPWDILEQIEELASQMERGEE